MDKNAGAAMYAEVKFSRGAEVSVRKDDRQLCDKDDILAILLSFFSLAFFTWSWISCRGLRGYTSHCHPECDDALYIQHAQL